MVKIRKLLKRNRYCFGILMLLILLGVGGTIAYNTNIAIYNNEFNLKYGKVPVTEEFTSPNNWKTCDETPKTVVTKNEGNFNIRVRLSYDEWWRDKNDENYLPLTRDGVRLTTINFQNEDDWEDGNDGWYYWKGELAPGESTRSLFKSVTYNCDSGQPIENICRQTDTGTVCEKPEDPYDEASYHVFVTVQTTDIDGIFPADTFFDVSIDPNGGNFNGSSDIYTDRVKKGTIVDLSSISYDDHELRDWTKNNDSIFSGNAIAIEEDTTLVANWLSNIYHNVTVDPNGGTYDGKTEISTYSVREGSDYSILDTTRDTFALEKWVYVGGDHDGETITGNTLASVTEDITIKAIWAPAVARIERTGKLYTSIMRAEAEAIANDTITLLVDTEEVVTNEKTVTLDLNTHTVTGSLTNTENGNLTLINGEINNPDGIAVTNNGILTLGYDDYLDTGEANIINDYIRLIGTTSGMKQNGTFNYYDGFLEGDIALNGGYNSAPHYHNIEQQTTIYYYPYITHIEARNCQHAELASADNSVSKTTVGGDIYYLNLQDNINTSAATGYKIYAVRNFNATYPLTVASNTEIEFNIAGYEVMFADTMTNNGTITISNSEETGKISASQTIINNGVMQLQDAEIAGTTSNDTIQNNSTLILRNSTISANRGYVFKAIPNTTLDMDENSYIRSYSDSIAAIYSNTDIAINNGHVAAPYLGIQMAGGTLNMTGGSIEIERDGGDGIYGVYCNNNSGCNINLSNNSKIIVKNQTESGSAGTHYGIFKVNSTGSVTLKNNASISVQSNGSGSGINDGGTVKLEDNSSVSVITNGTSYGIHSTWSTTIAEGSTASVIADGYSAIGLTGGDSYVNSGTVSVSAKGSGYATAINCETAYQNGNSATINGGTVSATNTGSGNATGIYGGGDYLWAGSININSGTISATTNSGAAYGISSVKDDYSNSSTTMTGGNLIAHTTSGTAYGAYLRTTNNTYTGGKVESDNFGIYANGNWVTIGNNSDDEMSITSPEIIGGQYGIYSGSYNFYDGIIRGGTNAFQEGIIKAIPDATIYYTEREPGDGQDETTPEDERTGRESCWLIDAENYLEVGGVGYNSLKKAYDAIAGDSGTIKVIANTRVEATLPESPTGKDITIDLNGHELIYTQSIVNNGTMTIVDNSSEHNGSLTNPSTYIINNKGTLNVESGLLYGESTAVYNTGNAVNITGGKIASLYLGIQMAGGTLNMTGGSIEIERDGGDGIYGVYCNNNSGCNINLSNNSKIIVKNQTESGSAGTHYGIFKVNSTGSVTLKNNASISVQSNGSGSGINDGGTVKLEDNSSVSVITNGTSYGIHSTWSTTIAEGSTASVIADGYSAIGLTGGDSYVNSGTVSVSAKGSGYATAINCETAYQNGNSATINGGTVSATNTGSGNATGIYGGGDYLWAGSININSGTISATTNSGAAYGISSVKDDYSNSSTTMTGGNLIAHTTSGTAYGAYLRTTNNTYTGGKVESDNFGIYANGNWVTIGNNSDDEMSITSPEIIGGQYGIYSGSYNFYDGIIRGGTNAFQEGIIKAIPDATIYYTEREPGDGQDETTPEDERTGRESCWLIDAENYLEVGGVGYNSLKKAYDAIAGDSGTIKVIANTRVEATLPESPTGKDITIDLNGHELIYTQSIVNNGTMTIVDNSSEHNGSLTNPSTYIINNKGTLNVKSGNLVSSSTAIYNSTNATFTMNGGKISAPYIGIYSTPGSTNTIGGNSLIEISGTNTIYGIYCDYSCSTTMKGNSIISVTGSTNGSYGIAMTTYGRQATAIMEGNAKIITSGSSSAFGIYGHGTTMRGNASINSTGTWFVHGIYIGKGQSLTIEADSTVDISSTGTTDVFGVNEGDVIMHSGTITATSTARSTVVAIEHSEQYQDWNYVSIDGGTIKAVNTADGNAIALRGSNSQATIKGGNIIAEANTGTSQGASNTAVIMSGGTITATSNSGTSYGVNTTTNGSTITGGTISGGNYGIVGNGHTVTLGENDGTINTDSPVIIGGDYGLYSTSYNFYDGIIKGGIDAFENVDIISSIATDSTVLYGTETIDNKTYQTSHLTSEYDCAQIGDTKYKKLSAAIAAAESNDTIELIADNYIFETINIPDDKNITIETNGFNITTSHPMTNTGKVKLINSLSSSPIFNYRGSQYYITNTSTAELELNNIEIRAIKGINNAGKLTISNSSITTSDNSISNTNELSLNDSQITSGTTAISNTGTVQSSTGDNSIITGATYAIYTDGGNINLATTTLNSDTSLYQTGDAFTQATGSILVGTLTNNSGTINMNGGSISKTGENLVNFIINNDTTTIKNATITFSSNNLVPRYQEPSSTIVYNTGSLEFNGTNITINMSEMIDKTIYAINNNGTQLTLIDTNVTTALSNVTSDSDSYYGLYNHAGNVDFYSGSIYVNRANSYGIYNETGEITIGQAESSSDPDYGQPTANVSITNPNIQAIGTSTGIGVKNNTGRVNFYDGIITGSTHPMPDMPDIPTKTEYHFEARLQTNPDNNQSVILKYIQSN